MKYARQSGGKGQYGHVKITIEPNEPGKGYEFINKIVGILEPIMKVAVDTPDNYMGTVIGDLNSRRGQIQGQDELGNKNVRIIAHVPLSEMFGYSNQLRSNTQGRASYVMEPHSYIEVPKSVSEKIVSKRAKSEEE